jgi:hypothetical protein
MAENRTISLTPEAKVIFSDLAERLPGFTFSGSLKEVAVHYLRCQEGSTYMPGFMDGITRWDRYVKSLDTPQVKTLQERLIQLDNLFKMRAMKWL